MANRRWEYELNRLDEIQGLAQKLDEHLTEVLSGIREGESAYRSIKLATFHIRESRRSCSRAIQTLEDLHNGYRGDT